MSDTLTAASSRSGRNRITSRALNRVATQVTSEELGVQPRQVGVELQDDGGSLTLTIKAAIHVLSLTRAIDDPGAVGRGGGTVIDRAAQARQNISARMKSITGSDVSRISLRLTSADITEPRRVR